MTGTTLRSEPRRRSRGRHRSAWSPKRLSNLRAWYDAELGQPKYSGVGAYVQLDGASTDNIFTLDSVATSFSNDIEVIMRVYVNDWTAAANQTLCGKYLTTGNQRSWRFYISTTGTIGLTASVDGTAVTSVIVTPTVPFVDATWYWLRLRLDLTNGANSVGTIEYAADTGDNTVVPTVWTANGTNTGTTIAGIFDGTAVTEVGGFTNGTLERLSGRVGRFILRSGFDGTTVADFNATDCYGDGYWHTGGYRWTLGLPKIYDRGPNGLAPATFGSGSNQPQWLPWTGRAQVYLPGASGNAVTCPDAAPLRITGDIDLRAEVSFPVFPPAAESALVSRYNTGLNQRSYQLAITTGGNIRLYWSTDGTGSGVGSATSTVAAPHVAGEWFHVRAAFDVDDGAGNRAIAFYTSPDGVNWNIVGSAVTAAGTVTIHPGTATLDVGAHSGGGGAPSLALIRRAIVHDGIDGTTVADFNAELCTQSGYTDSLGNVWTVNRATSGRKTVVQSPAARSARSLILHGTDDWIVVPVAAVPSLGLADSATITTAVRQHATAAGFRWYWAVVSGGGTELMSLQQRTTNACKAIFSDGVNTIDSSPSPAFTNGAMTVVGSRVQARSSFAAYVNGGSPATQSPAAVGALTPAQFTIAALAPASAVQEFEFGSLLTRDIAESDTEHRLTVAYYGGGY